MLFPGVQRIASRIVKSGGLDKSLQGAVKRGEEGTRRGMSLCPEPGSAHTAAGGVRGGACLLESVAPAI